MALNAPPSSTSAATCGFCSELCLKKNVREQGAGASLKCPICEKTAVLPEGGVDAIQKDLRRSYEADIVRVEIKMKNEDISCDLYVEASNGPAVSFCLNCGEFLCEPCSNYHKILRKSLDHELKPVGNSKLSKLEVEPLVNVPLKPLQCQVHQHEILKFYCETCGMLTCCDCMVVEHLGHTYNHIETVAEKAKLDLLSSFETASAAKAKLDDAISKGTRMMQLIQGKQKPVEESIERAFKVIISTLLRRKELLLTKIPPIKTELQTQGEKFKALRNEIAETCELITAATQVYTPAEVLSAKDAMTGKVAQMLKQYQKYNLDPCRSDLVADMLDTAELIKKISTFGVVIGGSHPYGAQTDLYIHGAVAGKEKNITISTFDANGKPYSHGGEKIEAKHGSLGSSDLTLTATIEDKNDGTYVASFTPQETGEHVLSVTLDSMPIKGSPFHMYVRKERDYKKLSSCKLSLSVSSSAYDVAVDDDGDIYVAVYGYHCITVFNQMGNQIRTIGKAGSAGNEDGQFNSPSAIAIKGNALFVVDGTNNRVQKLTTVGRFISKFGTYGAGNGQLNQPRSISIHNDGRIFISDTGNKRVSVYEANGTFLYHIAGNSTNGINLISPWGLAFDHHGNLHVIDSSTCFVKVFSPQGEFVTEYGGQQMISQPAGVAIDDEGIIFIAQMSGKLSVLNSQHQLIRLLQHGQSTTGVAIDKEGSVYTCSSNSCVVYKY